METSRLEIRHGHSSLSGKNSTHTPAGIMRDRALVDDDLGMPLPGLGEVKWLMEPVDGLFAVSGLSPPSGRDISWSRCSEKLPNEARENKLH